MPFGWRLGATPVCSWRVLVISLHISPLFRVCGCFWPFETRRMAGATGGPACLGDGPG
jgi:hypothetical protein